MAAEYRRKSGADTWHFCANCSHWPTDDFISSKDLPRSHQICNECICKNLEGDCALIQSKSREQDDIRIFTSIKSLIVTKKSAQRALVS